jgi:hypothetical protein
MIHIKFRDGTEFETKVDYQNGYYTDEQISGWGGPKDWGPKGWGPKRPKSKPKGFDVALDWELGWPKDYALKRNTSNSRGPKR